MTRSLGKAHLIGIGGTGMGSLAGLFREAGWEVRGSDTGVFPPMSEVLARLGCEVFDGWDGAHLAWGPDLVVVGNIARPDNPEALEAERQGLRCTSMSAAIGDEFLAGRHSIVVAGTHGKTTTTAMVAWGLESAGKDPGFLIGGMVPNFGATARIGGGELFVIEGDEYETAHFDRGPKFMHYRPRTGLLTSIELDHVEVFPDLDAVKSAFRRFVGLIPADGTLVACADEPHVVEVAKSCAAGVRWYGLGEGRGTRAHLTAAGPDGTTFDLERDGKPWGSFRTPLSGDHNLRNLAATAETLAGHGVSPEDVARGFSSFRGIRRRQEVRAETGGIAVIDDFAHHPTAVRETLRALKSRYPDRTLVAVFEPRTNSSRRGLFQEAYTEALALADRVIVAAVDHPELAPEGDRFDPEAVCRRLEERGVPARHLPEVAGIAARLLAERTPGQVWAVMSNGAFGGLHRMLVDGLAAASHRPTGAPPA